MRKYLFAVSAATLAIATPAYADPDGKREGKSDQGGQSMKADRGDRGGNGEEREFKGKERERQPFGERSDNDRDRNDDAKNGDVRKAEKMRGNDRREAAREFRNDDRVRMVERNFDRNDRDFNDDFRSRSFNGCPPGLAKKDNGCLPPGQAKKYLGTRVQQSFSNSLIPSEYRRWYRDDNDHFYRYGDNNIYRISRNDDLIDGIIPLFARGANDGGYYALGDQWPDSYDFYNVPYQYRSYYGDSSDYRYRYGDGAIYRINSGSGVIDGIVALLAGDLGVGSRLPTGYDTYNVPFSYRDRYADSDDNWYRYNDGYIYQVDPKTRLISAVIDAIV